MRQGSIAKALAGLVDINVLCVREYFPIFLAVLAKKKGYYAAFFASSINLALDDAY
jgi:hypothetical protein